MARSLTARAQAAVTSLNQHVPVRVIDRVFTGFGTLASAWLAFLMFYQLVTAGWRHLWAFIPFWLLVTYLILPRIHSLLSRIYLPGYFIGRTRTREGLLGDPVNIALQATEEQIHAAMLRAGWHRADELNIFTGWRTIVATARRRSYGEAPVSALYLFGRRQSFTYQQEVEGNPAKRHHVRFWPTPQGWLLPGGRRVDWLSAGTFDRAVGLSLFTGQLTHRIDANIDIERDHIIETLSAPAAQNQGLTVERLHHFSSGYHHRNGGGDRIETDGDLPIVDLRAIGEPSPQVQEAIAADDAEAAYRRPVPVTVAFGVGLMMLRVVLGIISLAILLGPDGRVLSEVKVVRELVAQGIVVGDISLIVRLAVGLYLLLYLVLAVYVYRGRIWARTLALLLSTVGIGAWALLWWEGAERSSFGPSLIGTALEILVILALASDTARIYVATRGGESTEDSAERAAAGHQDDGDEESADRGVEPEAAGVESALEEVDQGQRDGREQPRSEHRR